MVYSVAFGSIIYDGPRVAESLFDEHIPQPIKVSTLAADPNVTVISWIATQDMVFAHFAYSELAELASDEFSAGSARRTALFGNQNIA
ncbi:uncharacterized protein BJ212DRAFT_1573065 [Suillus subaureus]|uniref:Uncharacterized protein n=1 Tax=Suillus subaureus TaxID=48587 RepID=A0A9P7JIP9_9AGAM|nr:uncharacterized protein BJ212DRAFT_1573065 [Suillus subaureus]KAG1825548.1 hypothetical protein BJ212DRAFT_1573065 [Suillus subaureus]